MKASAALAAIEAILFAIDDDELPTPSRVEKCDDDSHKVVWFGSTGYHLGSAHRNGERAPDIYRVDAAREAIVGEALARLDAKDLAGGTR